MSLEFLLLVLLCSLDILKIIESYLMNMCSLFVTGMYVYMPLHMCLF